MNGSLTRIDAFDPKTQALSDARLGNRHRWPLIPADCNTTLVHSSDPLDEVLASHAKRGEWMVELDAAEQTEAAFAKILARVAKAKIKRLRIANIPTGWKRGWLVTLPASVEQLGLDLWSATVPDWRPLAKLPALRSLELFGPYNDGKPVDLSALAKCLALTQLSLQIPHVVLEAPPALAELDLRKVSTIETDPIPLKMLSVIINRSRDAGFEAEIANQIAVAAPGLEELIVHVRALKLSKLEPLAIPTTLRRLTLNIDARNAISLKPLAKLVALERLSLKGTFSHLDALSTLTELREADLYVWGNNSLDASNMTKLARVETFAEDGAVPVKNWKKPAKKKK